MSRFCCVCRQSLEERVITMSLAELRSIAPAPRIGGVSPPVVYAIATGLMALSVVAGFATGITDWTPAAILALPLVAITALWISGGAVTAILGLIAKRPRAQPVPVAWRPSAPTAILVTLCGEDSVPLAGHLRTLRAGLDENGLEHRTQIFVLSDTSGNAQIAAEEAALQDVRADGLIEYRRRVNNTGRKPGNIADWLSTHGGDFTYMMVLDADSRMSAARIRKMIWQIESRPSLGLLQAGISLVPGTTRFGCHQRVAARLLSRNFGRGFAAWTGDSGNYWGHNAIMRTAAFETAARLPRLSGAAPFGGNVLSHDFIEAAWMRRAGWSIALDPDPLGSAEHAPQTLAEFHRRDRRWCQGNLQHIRLLTEPKLCMISRMHLVAGIVSYLAAPIWLALIVLIASGFVPVGGVVPLLLVLLVLLVPKLCAMADWVRRTRTVRRRRVAVRALTGELVLSSLIAPLVMVRHSMSILSVCMGRDCGWRSGRAPGASVPDGVAEMGIGIGLLALVWASNGPAALWLAPIVLPLCAAPLIVRALDAPA
jgi:membrane glycosyltransferase